MTEQEERRILLVEDNPDFSKTAKKCLQERAYEVRHAQDYVQANAILLAQDTSGFSGVISDCFFPEETGSGKRSLGLALVDKMLATDESGKRIEDYEKAFEKIMDLDDELRTYVRIVGSHSSEDPKNNPIFKAASTASRVSREVGAIVTKNTLAMVCKEEASRFKDHYKALRDAIEKDESNQPLGIAVAELADELKLPVVLATSTNHHDSLTQPIQNYTRWPLVDCSTNYPNEKDTAYFWSRVLNCLERRIGESK